MFQRTRRGLAIASSSLKVLLHHPKLVLLPILSLTAVVVVVIVMGGTMYVGQLADFRWPFYVLGFIFLYFAMTFVTVFFNAALVSCVLDAFAGRKVSLRRGLSASLTRLSQIAAWAIFTTTIGLLLKFFQGLLRKTGLLGTLLGGAAVVSWNIATFFVIPVLVAENVEAAEAMKRSVEIVKRGWGNAIGVGAGLGILFILSFIPPILLIAFVNGDGALPMSHNQALALVGAGSALYLVVVMAVIGALSTVFTTGVYLFATSGLPPPVMNHALIEGAIRR
jgi:Family of unknown function (DUF6159)